MFHLRNLMIFSRYLYSYLFDNHLKHYHFEVSLNDPHTSVTAWHPIDPIFFSYLKLSQVFLR